MCGIAGFVDLLGRPTPTGVLQTMANAIVHRGPDEDGYFDRNGVGLASRRLSIVGLENGRQPISNEDRSVWVVFNGELFDYPEQRTALKAQGHSFRTSTDTELLPHMWEQYGEEMFERLRGQFAFALYDTKRNLLFLARDRFGICPLFFTVVRNESGECLLFGSEIKAILATGLVKAKADPLGMSGVFTTFAMPGPRTCFDGVTSLLPGQYLKVPLGPGSGESKFVRRMYWNFDFPDRGDEDPGRDEKSVVDGFENVLFKAVERRLRADVPVVSYLSGGVDSSQVVAMATKALGRPIPTFTIGVKAEGLNEEPEAELVAKQFGSKSFVVPFGGSDVMGAYPSLIRAAEMPVVDSASAAMLALARHVHQQGFKVALTGEGSDEWMAGYPWFKQHHLMKALDVFGLPVAIAARRLFARALGLPVFSWPKIHRQERAVGGTNAWLDIYSIMSMSRLMFFGKDMAQTVGDYEPYDDLQLPLERMAKWHPLNRSLALGGRVMLPGMLLLCKGDRVAMNSSVETRYPFLDEEVFAYLAKLHPRWKLRGLTDKYILRKLAERWLPKSIARRRKAMFRAPMDCFHLEGAPPYVEQLLSEESLNKTGYFDASSVRLWRTRMAGMRAGSVARTAIEMGLIAVTSAQLWHQTFVDSSIADVPSPSVPATTVGTNRAIHRPDAVIAN